MARGRARHGQALPFAVKRSLPSRSSAPFAAKSASGKKNTLFVTPEPPAKLFDKPFTEKSFREVPSRATRARELANHSARKRRFARKTPHVIGLLRYPSAPRHSHAHETREMFAATLATSGVTAVAGSPLGATRARRSPAVTSPVRLASPRRATSVRRRLDLGAVATATDRKPREVKARAQVTTEEVTVSEVSGSVAAPMPEDDSVKVRTNAHHPPREETTRRDDPGKTRRRRRAFFSTSLKMTSSLTLPRPSKQNTKHRPSSCASWTITASSSTR